MNKLKKILLFGTMILFLTSCQQEDDTYVPIKETGKEALEKETVEPTSEEETTETTVEEQAEEPAAETEQRVRVTAESLIIRQEMNTYSTIIRTVMNGEELIVLENQTSPDGTRWNRVRTADGGAEGYVVADYVHPVENINQ